MHGMVTYFIRRMLLVPVTFICITLMVYTVMRIAPGGPIEQAKLQLMAAMQEGGGGASSAMGDTGDMELTQEGLDQLKRYYKLDKPIVVGYMIWLGVWPDEDKEDSFSGILQGDFGVPAWKLLASRPGLEHLADAIFPCTPIRFQRLARYPAEKLHYVSHGVRL